MLPEIHLLVCGYDTQCTDFDCIRRATTIARWTDSQGRSVKQRELCERHAQWLKQWAVGVRDLRGSE